MSPLFWLVTYLVHSTVILGGVWLMTRRGPLAAPHHRSLLWRTAGIAALATTTLQVAEGPKPDGVTTKRLTWTTDAAGADRIRESSDAFSATMHSVEQGDRGRRIQTIRTISAELAPSTWDTPSTDGGPLRVRLLGTSDASLPAACRDAVRSHMDAIGEADAKGTQATSQAHTSDLRGARGEPELDDSRRSLIDGCNPEHQAGWTWALVIIWLVGGGLGCGRLIGRYRRFGRVLSEATPADQRTARVLRELHRNVGLRGTVTAFEAPRLRAPVAVSRSRIGLPHHVSAHLDEDELTATLAHELAHIVRKDPAWLLILQTLESLLWVQPLNILARRGFQEASEFLADEWAIRETQRPLGLARSLEKVTSWLVEGPPEPVPAMARADSPVVERVKRILARSADSHKASFRSLSAALLLPALLLPPVPIHQNDAEFRVMVVRERVLTPAHEGGFSVTPVSQEPTTEVHVTYDQVGS